MDAESPFEALARAVVVEVVAASPHKLDDYQHGRRGAFGYFAGRAVGGVRRRLGRNLQQTERQRVWRWLWEHLEAQPPQATDASADPAPGAGEAGPQGEPPDYL